MSKQTQQFELVEDVTLEELLREELEDNSGSTEEEHQVEKKDSEEMSHPKDGEVNEEDSQVTEKKEEDKEEEEVSEKKAESDTEEEDEVSEKKAESDTEEEDDEDKEESYDFSEDVKALEAAGEGLTEDYKSKAAVIFEAAVTAKIASEKKKLEESFKNNLHKSVNKAAEVITEKVDSYLDYVVATWMEENKVAVESGLRTELAESFISSLKKVFVENYVEVPVAKRDLYSELESKVSTLEESTKASQASLTEANKKLEKFQRQAIIAEASTGLADTQAERLSSLTSDIEFFSEEAFAAKVKTIKESYFKSSTSSIRTGVLTSVLNEGKTTSKEQHIPAEMKSYVNALSRVGKLTKQA
jgi:hypothetical protein